TSAATVTLAGWPSAARRAMQRGAGRPWPDGDRGERVERARRRRLASLRGQLRDALGTDSQQRANVANGQATADKLGGGLTGTGRCGGGELVGLPAQRRTSSAWYPVPDRRCGTRIPARDWAWPRRGGR